MSLYANVLIRQFRVIADVIGALDDLPERPVAVLDIDETCLDNRSHVLGLAQGPNSMIPESAMLFDALRDRDIPYAFVTGRRDDDRTDTIENLRAVGLGEYVALYTMPEDSRDIASYKEACRRDLETTHGLSVVCTVGDQVTDVAGTCTGIPFLLFNPWYTVCPEGWDVSNN